MKKYFLFFGFVFFAMIAQAETKPATKEKSQANKEGVSIDIDASRLKDVEQWVNNSKFTIDVGLKTIEKNSVVEQERMYVNLINDVLAASGTKPNEFLMRNILYRIQTVYEQVLRSVPPSAKRNAMVRRVLEDGVKWAVKLYQPDQKLLELAKSHQLPEELKGATFASIGMQWAYFMMDVADDAPNNSSRLKLLKAMMGLMFNDINNDDAVKRVLAPVSKNFTTKWEEIERIDPPTPLEKLMLAKALRQFMELHLEATKNLLVSYNIPIQRDLDNINSQNSPASVATPVQTATAPTPDSTTLGKLSTYNVGETIYYYNGNGVNVYTIKAYNPSSGKYIIDGNAAGPYDNRVSTDFYKVSGCVSVHNRVCVGQSIYFNNGNGVNLYQVLAVNPYTMKIVIDGRAAGPYSNINPDSVSFLSKK